MTKVVGIWRSIRHVSTGGCCHSCGRSLSYPLWRLASLCTKIYAVVFDEFTSSRCNATSFYNVLSVNIFSGGKPTDNPMKPSWALGIIYYLQRQTSWNPAAAQLGTFMRNGRLALGWDLAKTSLLYDSYFKKKKKFYSQLFNMRSILSAGYPSCTTTLEAATASRA